MAASHLLVIWHSRTGASEALARNVAAGAAVMGRLLRASVVLPEDILAASAYVFVCPENLATMSGEMKEMFDRCYYPVLGQIEGRAYATIIAAGTDGEGAQRQVDRIATGWRLRRVSDPWIVKTHAQTREEIESPKVLANTELKTARDLGITLAEALKLGIY